MKIVKPRVAPDARIPAIGYIRVSMAREEMISPELQRSAIEAWAKRTGHRIVRWVEDPDKTGRNFKRKIMEAIEAVERKEVGVIAVWKYSRFGRNRTGIEWNLARIENAGGQLLSATEEVDATTSSGWLQRDMLFSIATFESKRAGEVWKETHDSRRNDGLPAGGGERFGYIWHQRRVFDPDGTVHLQDERYEPNPETSEAAAALFPAHLDGTSFRALTQALNAAGFRTSRGNLWTINAVMRYMDSGFAAGYLRVHSECPNADCVGSCNNYKLVKHPTKHHPQIITEATWQKYVRHRAKSKQRPQRTGTKYPLSQFPRCSLCGGGMKRVGAANATRALVCRTYDELGPAVCKGSRVVLAELERGVLAFLAATATAGGYNANAETIDVDLRAKAPTPETERVRLEAQIGKIDRAIGRAMRSHAMADDEDPEGILEAEHQKLLAEFRDEKAALAEQLAALSPQAMNDERERRIQAVRVAAGLIEEWLTLPAARANALLGIAIERIVILPDYAGFDVYPTWQSEPWNWVSPRRPALKKESIEKLWAQHPQASGREIAERLAAEGVTVTPTYALVVRNKMAFSAGKSRETRRYSQGGRMRMEEREARERVRLEAAKRFEAGHDVAAVADDLQVTKRTVWRWHKVWREQGAGGLMSASLPRRRLVGAAETG